MESGKRIVNGKSHQYELYFPIQQQQSRGTTEPEPVAAPLVIIIHGFGASLSGYRQYAAYLSKLGCWAMLVNMSGLNGLTKSSRHAKRQSNIFAISNHLNWLLDRSNSESDPLYRRVDPHRLALAGHSAGGAVAFEAACDIQRKALGTSSVGDARIRALLLLDAVPWLSTIVKANEQQFINANVSERQTNPSAQNEKMILTCSLRCQKGGFNADGLILELLASVQECAVEENCKRVVDIHIPSAKHGDFMDETWYSNSWLLSKAGIFSTKKNRALLKALSASFLASAFGLDLSCLDEDYKEKLLQDLNLSSENAATSDDFFSQALISLEEKQQVTTTVITRDNVPKVHPNNLPFFLR